jgi:hypothetical protein
VTGRAVALQGGLAALGLVAAYFTWQRQPDGAPGDVVVIDAGKGDLAKIHFEDENNTVDIERGKGGGDAPAWLHIVEKAGAKTPPSPHGAPKPPTEDKSKPKPPRDLRGNEQAGKLLESFAPLRSPRGFGVLPAPKLKELGLDDTKRKLVVNARGETREFVIGQPVGSSGESYLKNTRDGRVYIMPRSVLGDLQGASFRLVERQLHAFKIPEVDRLVVSAGGKTRELAIQGRENPATYKLVAPKAPDKPDEMARNWHEKVWRIFPTEIMGKGERPAGGDPQVAIRVDYLEGKKKVGWLEIAKTEPKAEPASQESTTLGPVPPPPKPDIYARTENTAGWVKIQGDVGYITDAEKIAAGN